MNWDIVEGKWHELKGKVQAQWGKLTNDDLDIIAGRRQELAGRRPATAWPGTKRNARSTNG